MVLLSNPHQEVGQDLDVHLGPDQDLRPAYLYLGLGLGQDQVLVLK